jgi:cytochrome c2
MSRFAANPLNHKLNYHVKNGISSLALAVTLSGAVPAAAQDAAAGAVVFQRCAICHAIAPGTGTTFGPPLGGVVGRKAGTVPGFSYSDAMTRSGVVWDRATLDKFIAHPQQVVRGNRMPFTGLDNDAQRANLLAYLESVP